MAKSLTATEGSRIFGGSASTSRTVDGAEVSGAAGEGSAGEGSEGVGASTSTGSEVAGASAPTSAVEVSSRGALATAIDEREDPLWFERRRVASAWL